MKTITDEPESGLRINQPGTPPHLVHLEPSADEKFRVDVAPVREPQAKSHKRTPQDTDLIRMEHTVAAASRVPFI